MRVPLLVRPRFLVIESWILACAQIIVEALPGAHVFTGLMALSFMQGAFIVLGALSSPRPRVWWSLLFFINQWGFLAGIWIRRPGSTLPALTVTTFILGLSHLTISALVWGNRARDLFPAEGGG